MPGRVQSEAPYGFCNQSVCILVERWFAAKRFLPSWMLLDVTSVRT